MTRHLLNRLTFVFLLLAAMPLMGQVPYQVKVINPTYSASIRDAVGMNGIGYFVAGSYLNFSNGQWDEELWRTDGTEAGTFRVKDIRAGDLGSSIKWMTVVGNTLYFSANDGTGDELWKSDGTSAGTVRVVELSVGSGGGNLQSLVDYNGVLHFIGTYANGSTYLFRSDGTAAGTVPVSTAVAPSAPTFVDPNRRLTLWNGYLWFMGANIPFTSSGLYRSDGTSAGTTLIKTLSSPGSDMVAGTSQLFFTANDPTYRREVWRSDGTAAGTYMTKDLNPINSGFNGDSSAWIYWTVGDVVLFSGVDGNPGFNRKLYRSDGTVGGTWLLADIYPGFTDVTNGPRTNADRTYMVWESRQQGGSSAPHLYVTDGTIAGTVRLKTFLSFCQNFMAMDGVMYFRASDGSAAGGAELWRTNGTVAGTYRYADINPGPNGSDPYPVGFFGNIGLLHAGPSYPQLWAFRLCNSAPQPTVSFSPATVCAGNGAGTATVTNAAGFTTFNWTIVNGAFDSATNGSSVSFHATSSSAVQLTVTATGDGCQQQATVSIPTAAPATPAITASGPTTFCEGGAVTLTASAGSSYAWSNGATTQSITAIASGSYSVTVTDTSGCSATSAATTVTVNPLPAGMISAGGPITFCEGGSVTLTAPAGMASYTWSNGATTQSITATTTGNYDVTFTNANGCSSTVGVPVTVHPAPTATLAASGPTTFCEGGNVTLTAGAADSWSWSNGATTQSITVNASGSYSVTVTNANGCSATSTPAVVTVNAAPSATITPTGPTTFCEGGYVGLIAPAGMASYSWSNGATGPSITATASGNYTVTVTDANGCSATSAPVTVTRNPLPDATISASGPTTFCEGGSVTLTAAAGMASYAWTNGATSQSITVNASGNYAVTVTTAEGCSASSSATPVTVNPLPSPVIAVANQYTMRGPVANSLSAVATQSVLNYCGSVDINLIVSQPQNYTSFLWSTGATTPLIHVTEAGTYTVTVTNANGCSASDSVTITVTPTPPAPVITASTPALCPNGSVTLTSSAADSYLWSTGATTQSIMVTEPGYYSVSVNVNGCSSPSSSINFAPRSVDVTASGPTTFCNGGSVTLTASAADSYLWSTGATTQSISVTSSGNYTVTAGFTDGCSITSAPVPVTVGDMSTTISADRTTLCPGNSIHLTSSVSGGPAASYQWYTTGIPISGATTATLTLTPANGGYVYLIVTDANGCTATSNAVVYSVSEPSASITALGPTTFCEGGSTTLMGNAGASYLWSTGATSPSINVTQSGSYSVTVMNADGCSATSAATVVTVNANPETPAITAGGPTTFCEGGSVTLSAPAGYTYVWNTGATTQSITVNASGSYGVTVSNGNCTATSAPATVTVNPKPATPAITPSGPTTFCEGGSVTLTAPAGYTYFWSNNATTQSIVVSASGSYSVTVTSAAGCSTTSAPTTVTVNPLPPATITPSGPTTFCPGGSVTLTAPAGYTYLWSTGAITQSIVASTSGNYTVTVTGAGSCSRTSAATTVVVNPPTVITAQPQNVTMTRNQTRVLSVTATGTPTLQYQWYEGLTGDTSKPKGTGSQLTIGPYQKKGTYFYWVRVTSTTCSGSIANSTAATVTVNN